METRANYVLIGAFTLAVVLGVFGFVYWFQNIGGTGERAFYKVQFEPASTFDFTSGHATYTGPTNIVPKGTHHVLQAVNTVAFEGVVTWIIGVGPDDEFVFGGSATPPSLSLTF